MNIITKIIDKITYTTSGVGTTNRFGAHEFTLGFQ